MKRNLIIILILTLTSFSVSYAVPIDDPANPHNMSNLATHSGPKAAATASGGTDEICIFCHTPHSAAPQTPLWSRPDPDTMGSFPVYAQPLGIMNDTALTGYDASNPEYPSGASRMCLSCHDGATSIGVLLGNESIIMESGSDTITTPSAIIDLATSHPISFNYNNGVIAAVLNPVDYQLPPDGDGIDTPLDGSGQMQCTTCHDPHEDTRGSTGIENLPFWCSTVIVGTTLYDDVCNSCHIGAGGTPVTPPHTP